MVPLGRPQESWQRCQDTGSSRRDPPRHHGARPLPHALSVRPPSRMPGTSCGGCTMDRLYDVPVAVPGRTADEDGQCGFKPCTALHISMSLFFQPVVGARPLPHSLSVLPLSLVPGTTCGGRTRFTWLCFVRYQDVLSCMVRCPVEEDVAVHGTVSARGACGGVWKDAERGAYGGAWYSVFTWCMWRCTER